MATSISSLHNASEYVNIGESISGNSIFLPAAGCRINSSLQYFGEIGSYWSGTMDLSHEYGAVGINFEGGDKTIGWGVNWYYRQVGRIIRPVSN